MIFLCKAVDVPVGRAKRIARGRKPAVAVFEVGGVFHATADQCTHGTALLSRGKIIDGVLICPLHAGSFDLVTGAPVDPPCDEPLAVYRVELRDDGIYADVPD
ncbi:non-heme iron oxygenase ferredoxin subunit [Novosphingobium sp. Leaf2]|uniref:non-heme iron oxygenase ferredoxin subunit n=1 Tax=Novosphingobium sp. Leaf2 TaxID=1735670 RepID=UPI0006F5FAB3|nr:non-heme iron oxygenase ferredoxin subunit [Novosphingobium sp. Leaf2]KQM14749.1 ferredoxin [Novosphingobium sp. Leaf2]